MVYPFLLSIKCNKYFYIVISVAAFLYCSPLLYAQGTAKKVEFNEVLENVESLLKSDIELAFNALAVLDDKLDALSVDQQLKYYLLLFRTINLMWTVSRLENPIS